MFDVTIGYDNETKQPIVLTKETRLKHELIVGDPANGCRTHFLSNQIKQDIQCILRGGKGSLIILDNQEALIRNVLNDHADHELENVKVLDFTNPTLDMNINLFKGNDLAAASNFQQILSDMETDQDAFFKSIQDTFVFNSVIIGKARFGDDFSLPIFYRMISEVRYLAIIVDEVDRIIEENCLHNSRDVEQLNKAVYYFDDVVLKYKWKVLSTEKMKTPLSYPTGHKYEGLQVVENRQEKFLKGLKSHIERILAYPFLQSQSADFDDYLRELLEDGGILLVNVGESAQSKFLGKCISGKVSQAICNRSVSQENIPVFVYFNDFQTFFTSSITPLLVLGRAHNTGIVASIKKLDEIDREDMDATLMSNIQSLVIFEDISLNNVDKFMRIIPQLYSDNRVRNTITTSEEIKGLSERHFMVRTLNLFGEMMDYREAFI